LYDFLQEKGGRFWMDGTGSTPEASLIGNIMERGFGGTENADHVAVSCGYEIVLPDGELLHTGYTAYPSARVAAVDAWSPGPQVQGLFSQSNLGIVTNLSFPLLPAPEHLELLTLDIANREQLITAVDTMRLLQLDGTLRSAPWFGNCYRVLSTLMRFPWHRTEPPLEPELAAEIAREHGISWFTGFASIYGPKQQVLAARRHATALLRRAGVRVEVADRQKLADTPHSARRSVQLSMLRLYSGGVMNATRRAYWRKRMTIPADGDLDNDGVGFIFVNASLPLVGADVAEAGAIGERVVLAHGFEPNFNCISVRPRALLGILTFAWNRDIPGDDERAFAAHDQLADRWAERGWYPLRLGLHSMKLLDKAEPSHRAFVRTLKQAVDPRGIIAPGRY
jgi:4-cresol dehydrogenase (hydroxylating)